MTPTITETEIILPNDPRAAELKTVEGWVSRDGFFYGKEEHLARLKGSTHKECERCEKPYDKKYVYTVCPACFAISEIETYKKMPFKEWDGKIPVQDYMTGDFFFDVGMIEDYCEMEEVPFKDLCLVICEPNYLKEVEVYDTVVRETWPEDTHSEFHNHFPLIAQAIDDLNKQIRNCKNPVSWTGGKFRTEYKPE